MLKQITLLILLCITFNGLVAQEKGIELVNEQTGKESVIKENKRIRIKTTDGDKISGKYTIFDNETIIIKGEKILLSEIERMKRHPLLISLLTSVILFYYGSAFVFTGVYLTAYTGENGFLLYLIPSAAFIYGGIKSPNFLKGYKTSRNWKYEIISLTE